MATSYKCEALLSGLLTQQILPTVQRKLMCGWCFILLIFLRVYSRKSFLTPGYVTPHSKNVVVRKSYPSFSRLCCPVFFSSSNTIACTQEVHYVHYYVQFWYSHIFTLSSDTIRDTSFFTFLTRYDTVKDKENQQEQAHSKIIGNYNTWKWWFPRLLFFVSGQFGKTLGDDNNRPRDFCM